MGNSSEYPHWTLARLWPEKTESLQHLSLSREYETTTEKQGRNFQLLFDPGYESWDMCDTAQLLIFIKGIAKDFEIMKELVFMQSMKETTSNNELHMVVNTC